MPEIENGLPADTGNPQSAQNIQQERLKQITEGIEKGIKQLFASDHYADYLRVMSRFHHYSLNNTMLIYMQKPNASLVAGFNKWRDQFKRHVIRGEKSIKIIAPTGSFCAASNLETNAISLVLRDTLLTF